METPSRRIIRIISYKFYAIYTKTLQKGTGEYAISYRDVFYKQKHQFGPLNYIFVYMKMEVPAAASIGIEFS